MTRHAMRKSFFCHVDRRDRVSHSRLDVLSGGISLGILVLIVGLLISLPGSSGG